MVIGGLGCFGGFFGNFVVCIELFGVLQSVVKLVRVIGQGCKVDELVIVMNWVVEQVVLVVKFLLVNVICLMSVEDGLCLLKGGDIVVMQFFEGKICVLLVEQFLLIVMQVIQKFLVVEKYNVVVGKVVGFGFVKKEDVNVQQYVMNKVLDGLFLMMVEEEKKICKDLVGIGSVLLKKVFGGL